MRAFILLLILQFLILEAHAQSKYSSQIGLVQQEKQTANRELPDPHKVWKQSLVIPGWGQITNRQIWKVPIIYGLLGGVIWNIRRLTIQYHDYRAAFYNLNNDDERYGSTPAFLANEQNSAFLQNTRDNSRTQRDQMILGLVLAYGLNIIDAYIYAHFRTFDVSDDLTIGPSIDVGPNGPYSSVKLNFSF